MNSKLRILGATAALAIAPLAGISYAAAQNGADDPAGHVRHSGVDDPRGTPTSAPTSAPTREAGDDHGRRHGGHGADDPATHDAGDDHGGLRDDATDDSGSHGGHGGHGGDDSGSDDHGGHGSDD